MVPSSSSSYKKRDYDSSKTDDHRPYKRRDSRDDSRGRVDQVSRRSRSSRDDHHSYTKKRDERTYSSKRDRDYSSSRDKVEHASSKRLHSQPVDKKSERYEDEIVDFILGRSKADFSVKTYILKDISFAFRRLGTTTNIQYLDHDMILALLSHAICLRPAARDISMILNGLGKVVLGASKQFSYRCMEPLTELLHLLPDSSPLEMHISNAINGLSKFVEHGFALPDQKRTMKTLSKLVLQLSKCKPEGLTISMAVLGLSKFIEKKYALYNEKETMDTLCNLVALMPDLHLSAGNIACLLSGLGKMAEKNVPFTQPASVSLVLCTLVKRLASHTPTAQEITMTIHGLSKFAERDFEFQKKEELMASMRELILLLARMQLDEKHITKSLFGLSRFVQRGFAVTDDTFDTLCTLVNRHYKLKPKAQDCAITVLAVSKFVDCGYSLPNKEETMKTLCSLVRALPDCNPNGQNMANAILGISKFVEHEHALVDAHEIMVALSKLFISLSKEEPNGQQISNALLGLSKFAERGFSLPDFDATLAAISTLVHALPGCRHTAQDIALSIHALGKFIEHGYTLPDSKCVLKVVCGLVQTLPKLHPNGLEIGLTLLGLSKFLDLELPLHEPRDTMKALCVLVQKLPKKSPTSQNIANTVLGLSKFVERNYQLSNIRDTMTALSELAILLPQKNPFQQSIATTLHGLGKLLDSEYRLPNEEEITSALKRLVIILAGKECIAQDVSLTLLALSKFIKQGYVPSQSDELNKAIYTLVTSLLQTATSSQNLSTTIFAMGKFVELGFAHDNPDAILKAICKLSLQVPRKAPTAQDIAYIVFSLSKYVEAGYTLQNEKEVMALLCSFVKQLPSLDPTAQSIALTMRGIATMIERGCNLPETEKTIQILCRLFTGMPHKSPQWQSIHNAFKALSLLIKQKRVDYATVQGTTTALLPLLEKTSYENVSVCELLITLSEMGFVDRENWANRFIKKISTFGIRRRDYLAQTPLTQGILGYARLVNGRAEDEIIALLRRAQRCKLSINNILMLIQAHAIFKAKGATNILAHIDIARLQKALLAKDPTPEEKMVAGITEESIVTHVAAAEEAVIAVAGLVQMTNQVVALKPMLKPASYDLTTALGQRELGAFLQAQGIEYVAEYWPLIISPVFVIQNQLGAFAKEELSPNQVFGTYVGKVVEGEEAIKESMYAFYVADGPDGTEQFVDARYKRNYAAFFNHSSCYNISTTLNDHVIGFEVADEPILANEQCFISYGDDFFPLLGFEPLYIDTKDSWESFDQLVLQNRDSYCQHAAYVSEELQKAFRLPTQKLLLSKLSQAILEQNEKEALRLVKSQADLWSYCVTCANEIMPPQNQQRISALMLACYLGQTAVVEALLTAANGNARLLQTGEAAATFALKGRNKDRYKIFKMLYDQGIYYNLTNREGVHFLNLAVDENLPEVVELLLKGKPREVRKELIELFANSQTDSMYTAIVSGKLEGLKVLLTYTTPNWLAPLIVDRELLVLKALEDTAHFDAALSVLIESGNIHKNRAAVNAILTRFGSKASSLLAKSQGRAV